MENTDTNQGGYRIIRDYLSSNSYRRFYSSLVLHTEYLKLIGLQELNQLHKEIGDDIFEFHRTYKFIKAHSYAPSQLIEAAEHLDELPLLRSEREELMQENQNLEKP